MSGLKTLDEFLAVMADVLRNAHDTEQRQHNAEQQVVLAYKEAERVRAEIRHEREQAKAELAAERAAHGQRLDELEDKVSQRLAGEKEQHDAYVKNAQRHVQEASETNTALNLQNQELRHQRDAILVEIAKIKAAFAESAAKF